MKFKNRFIRMAMAFAIVGVVATQIPARPSVSLAADGYVDNGNGLLTLKGAGGAAVGGVLVGAVYGAIVNAGKTSGGATIKGAGLPGAASSIYEVISGTPDFSDLAKLIRNSGSVDKFSQGSLTIFAPTNSALAKALGANKVGLLGEAAGSDEAKKFLDSITVAGSYNLQRLKDAASQGKTLQSLSGDPLVLKLEGDKLTVNGIEILSNEYPASNGWVLSANGVVAAQD
ncbi:fasciclin domain-containing protein [Armatimonas rosea]|uniref:Putative surface protein with fasciclin (FAS1) repeats n=1 Tax=Armatimonas rosea TaxID=685828 RepID=A0A7W9SR32_ARMRO|nr:fasciclin domain-containing protein [Armatimonas rosea]MBB6050473.1 putative surface protein with fasciclin (FAS1) repeats [Armatimonas rosea]